jgi:hypothetical protein
MILFTPYFPQVLMLVLRILAAEFVVKMLTLRRWADPDVNGGYTTRVSDGLDALKETLTLSFQVRANHFVLSIQGYIDRIIEANCSVALKLYRQNNSLVIFDFCPQVGSR